MTLHYVTLGCAILLGVAGQLLLKEGAVSGSVLAQLTARESILGLMLYAAAAFCYMFALRKIPVSVAFPSVSLSYVVVAAAAYWFQDEPLGWDKLAGVLIICSGVFLVARSA